ncbi:MAG: PepSY-associated TM helix domain-containing protein, partial [Rhodocyclaceae bacterium]
MIKSATLRTFLTLHTWTGIVAGLALFVAFYAGALTMFHGELHAWQSFAPHTVSADDGSALIEALHARHPEARTTFALQPATAESPEPMAWWIDAKSMAWQHASLAELRGEAPPTAGSSALSDLINDLHYSLGIPKVGIYLMGIVSLMYGVALISGVLIHLPTLLNDLFALRKGKNLKRMWQDTHNVVGILSLPFHVIFAVTGTVLCLSMLIMATFNTLSFDGKLTSENTRILGHGVTRTASGQSAPMLSPAALMERARSVQPTFEPVWLSFEHYGDRNAFVEVRGETPGALGTYGGIAVDAVSGDILTVQVGGQRDVNHGVLAGVYGLHFGSFGGFGLRVLYFLLGLAGALLFYSGNLLWIESRRKRQQTTQNRSVRFMARLTVGVCFGLASGIAVAFIANLLASAQGADVGMWERIGCFSVWALCLAWAYARPPARAGFELPYLAAALCATAALLDLALRG